MAGHRLVGVGAAAVAAAVILSGCSFGGAVRQAPNPTTGRPPVELTRVDAMAVAIFNAAVPYNAGTAGASATGQPQAGSAAGTGATTTPGAGTGATGTGTTGTGTGATGTGTTGTTPPAGTGTTGAGTTGTTPPAGTATGTTGAGTGATGTTGTTPPAATGTAPGTSTGGAAGTGATGTAGTGTTGAGTGTTGTTPPAGTGTTASPGVTSRTTPSTGPGVDWTRIQKDFHTLTTAWSSARATVKGNGANTGMLTAVDDAVSALGTSITTRSALATALAANDLTAYTTALLGMYRTATPVQIYNMEYLAREVELDTETGNQEGALDAARGIGAAWASLRTAAMARNRGHAGAVDAEVGRIAADVASGANLNLRSDAATLLRDLQILTRDFATGTATR